MGAVIKALKRYDIILTMALFLLAIPAERAEHFALVEDQLTSVRQQLRMAYGDVAAQTTSEDIVLVNTDEEFFHAYKSFPLRRTDIARIVTNLHALGAKVVAVDMLMDFPSSYDEDPTLADALKNAGNTILVAQASFDGPVFKKLNYPTALLDQASVSAYTNISSNSSIITSLSRLKIHPEITQQRHGWPFAVTAAAMYLGVEPEIEPGLLRLGDLEVPLDQFNNLYIDFPPLPTGTQFLSESRGITALEFIDLEGLDERDLEELSYWVRDKIVLVGDTSEVSHDWFDTPVGMVYGVEIIANTIDSILKGGPLRAASLEAEAAAVLIVMALMIVLAIFVTNPLLRGLGAFGVLGGYLAANSAAYVHEGVVFSMAYVLSGIVLSYLIIEFRQYQVERDQKRQIAKTFGQYIPTELVEEMNRTGEKVEVGGESREMTVLFSDVRGFTTISEGLPAQELTVLMNAFLSPMTKVIHQHRGTIDKYMGDAIMAFWGAPLADPEHARHAVQAALAMNKCMADMAEDFVARGWKPIKIGVGLNTGIMNVGNMGSDFRLAYTVLGDSVNLGSRIESLTKQYGVQTMISEFTLAAVSGLITRELDLVRVKGKDTPVAIFEPLGFEEDNDVDAQTIARLDRHHQALADFRSQKFAEAKVIWQALAAEEPDRMIYEVYLGRIAQFEAEPPGGDWDGVFTHQSK